MDFFLERKTYLIKSEIFRLFFFSIEFSFFFPEVFVFCILPAPCFFHTEGLGLELYGDMVDKMRGKLKMGDAKTVNNKFLIIYSVFLYRFNTPSCCFLL